MFAEDKFKKLRKEKKLTQKQLAELLGRSLRTIQLWEKGSIEPPKSVLPLISKILEVPITSISDHVIKERAELKGGHDKLDFLSKSLMDFSSKSESEKFQMFMDMQKSNEVLLYETRDLKRITRESKTILNSIDYIIYRKNRSLKYVFVNDFFLSYFGISETSLIVGQRDSDIFSSKKEWMELNLLEQEVLKTQKPIENQIIQVPNFSGKNRIGLLNLKPAINEEDKLIGVIGYIKDISGEQISREKHFYMESVLEKIEYVIWIIKLKPYRHYLYINKAIESVYGVTKNNFYQNVNFWFSFIHKDDRKKTRKEIDAGNKELIYRIVLQTGKIRWIRHFNYNAVINDEEVEFCVIKDITQEKLAEEKNELLEININEMVDALSVRDISAGRYIYLNKAIEKVYGCSIQDAYKEKGFDLWLSKSVHPDFLEKEKEYVQNKSWPPVRVIKIFRGDGKVRFVEVTLTNKTFSGRECRIAISRDVTERIRIEKMLNLLEANINSMDDAVFVRDLRENKYIYINRAAENIIGCSLDEIPDKDGFDYLNERCIHPDDREIVNKMKFEAVDNMPAFRIIKPDGEVRWLESSVTQKKFGDRECIIKIARDITERKKSEEIREILEGHINVLNEALIVRDLETQECIYVNNAVETIFGYPKDTPVKDTNFEFWLNKIIHSEAREKEKEYINNNSWPKLRNVKIIKPNGDIALIEISLNIKTFMGRKTIVSVYRDISDRFSIN
ncbi:MAG TPA: PAS domain S-box protein [Victivallales bacterium]|nr:PAS domain S-box protein [Victivallales bacterium]